MIDLKRLLKLGSLPKQADISMITKEDSIIRDLLEQLECVHLYLDDM